MEKEELDELNQELQAENEHLIDEVEYWKNKYYELEKNIGIKDIDHFIWKLKIDGLYTEELERFIEDYMKWYND